MRSIEDLVDELRGLQPGQALRNYITHIRFPNFKALERGSLIKFSFPFTALVGANGIGKSSVLHALQGTPEGQSTAKYWFATALDPITSKVLDPPRYIYGHWHQAYGQSVETRKARVFSRSRGYEYWEPTKATKTDKMEPMPDAPYPRKDADRWNAVERAVVYLNMKVAIGAFDRAFNFGLAQDQIRIKHHEMKAGARLLRSAIDRKISSWHVGGGRERIFENRYLTDLELKHLSQILGRKYVSARYVRHSLYPNQQASDVSVIFDRGFQYSEAFAGSGEVAVVSAVVKILNAPQYALVLLDEPETSLHPGAQRELLRFMLEQIRSKQIQIVISTHSMEFLQGLPDDAIKVFEDNGQNQSRILNECSAYVALKRLGKPAANKKRVYVEDHFAKVVVEQAADGLDPGERAALEIVVAQGGADGILANQIPTHILAETESFVLLDGDKKHVEEFSDPDGISPNAHLGLGELIKSEIGCTPKFALNGGNDAAGNIADKIVKQLEYLRWIGKRLCYLPRQCADAILLGEKIEDDDDKQSAYFKEKLYQKIGKGQTPEGALGVVKFIVKDLDENNADLTEIRIILKKWLALPIAEQS